VASQALLPRAVYDKLLDLPGMACSRSVTIFALDFLVPGVADRLEIFFMAFGATLPALVLDRKIFPFVDIAQAIIVVGKGVTVNAEILRYHEVPGNHNQQD